MKLISTEKYEGLHHTGKASPHTALIYKAKFLQEKAAIDKLVQHVVANIKKSVKYTDQYTVVPVNPRIAKISLPHTIAKKAALKLHAQYKEALYKGNTKSKKVFNEKIILLDDIVYSGATLRKAEKALLKAGAKEVICVTLAYSTRFKKPNTKI